MAEEKPSPETDSLSIAAFPEGKTAWRIDWFGDVAFADRRIRRLQPSVFVHLSPVTDLSALANQADLLHPSATDSARRQTGRWISIGTLPLLRVGDIWQNQRLVCRPDYQLETFSLTHINSEMCSLVKAGLNKDDKGFLLPLAEHPWHRQGTHSYCIEVRLPGDRRLIVPCMELARFYFGSSSSLLTQLFLPPLQREALYTQADFDDRARRITLKLAPRISGVSAADIGRLHMSRHAWQAALSVGTSMLKASTTGQAIHPRCFFPFEGVTNLTASGKWLSWGGEPDKTFVVFSLRSCTHPFPFQSLKYEASGSKRRPPWQPQDADTPPEGSQRQRARAGVADSTDQRTVERDPSNQLKARPRHLRSELRFPDLAKKPVWREQLLAEADGSSAISAAGGPRVQEAAAGQPGSERRVRPVELSVAMTSKQPPPEFLMPLLKDLGQMQSAKITLLTASEHNGWTIPVPLVQDFDGEIDPNLFIEPAGGNPRLRQAAVFHVATRKLDRHFVAIEDQKVFLAYLNVNPPRADADDSIVRAAILMLNVWFR